MERVAFLIEKTGRRLNCLLNPEDLAIQRSAGVQPRRSIAGALTGTELSDDPLLFTGGGTTTMDLSLLFDVSLDGSAGRGGDVRTLTRMLWNLAENSGTGYGSIPTVRFIWGKLWNVPGVIAAVSERFEHFTADGTPRRSWLRLRLIRVSEPDRRRSLTPGQPSVAPSSARASVSEVMVEEAVGGVADQEAAGGSTVAPYSDAGDIVEAAIAETPARLLAAAAEAAVRSTAEEAADAADEIPSATSGDRSITESIVSTIEEVVKWVAGVVASDSVDFADGAKSAARRSEDACSGEKEAIAALPAARRKRLSPITDVLDEATRALDGLRAASEAATTAIRSQAQKTAESALVAMKTATDTLSQLVGANAAVQGLVEALSNAARTGDAPTIEQAADAVGTISSELSGMWEEAGASVIDRLEESIAQICEGAYAMARAQEVANTIWKTEETIAAVEDSAGSISDELEGLAASQEIADSDEASRAIAEAREAIDALRPRTEVVRVETVAETAERVRAALQTAGSAAAETRDRVTAKLDKMEEAVRRVAGRVVAESATAVLSGPGPAGASAGRHRRAGAGERLDQIAFEYYGNAAMWRTVARHNDIDDPLRLGIGRRIEIPPTASIEE